jgi:hypothetical protein
MALPHKLELPEPVPGDTPQLMQAIKPCSLQPRPVACVDAELSATRFWSGRRATTAATPGENREAPPTMPVPATTP